MIISIVLVNHRTLVLSQERNSTSGAKDCPTAFTEGQIPYHPLKKLWFLIRYRKFSISLSTINLNLFSILTSIVHFLWFHIVK
jgi:hypothetical protein